MSLNGSLGNAETSRDRVIRSACCEQEENLVFTLRQLGDSAGSWPQVREALYRACLHITDISIHGNSQSVDADR